MLGKSACQLVVKFFRQSPRGGGNEDGHSLPQATEKLPEKYKKCEKKMEKNCFRHLLTKFVAEFSTHPIRQLFIHLSDSDILNH